MISVIYILLIVGAGISICVCCGMIGIHHSTQWSLGWSKRRVSPFRQRITGHNNGGDGGEDHLIPMPEAAIVTAFENPVINDQYFHEFNNNTEYNNLIAEEDTLLYLEDDPTYPAPVSDDILDTDDEVY